MNEVKFPSGGNVEMPDFGKAIKRGAGGLRFALLGILALILLLNSFYTINTEEVGILLRLGKYRGPETDAGPGLHFKIPVLDQVVKVPIERQLKAEFGFRTEEAAVRSRFSEESDEANMLTGDKNAAVVEWVVQYRIIDAYKYIFRVRNVDITFRDMSEAVMRRVVGDRTVNEVVTIGRGEIERQVEQELQALCDQYETGIRVDQVVLQNSAPPDPVKPAFNEVNQAEQDRDTLINEAQAQYNRVIPRAEGQARQAIEQAEGYALNRVNRSQGDAARFSSLYAEYRKAPEVTRKRLYLETMNTVLPNVGRKLVVDDSIEGLVPLLEMQQIAPAAARARTQEQGGGQ